MIRNHLFHIILYRLFHCITIHKHISSSECCFAVLFFNTKGNTNKHGGERTRPSKGKFLTGEWLWPAKAKKQELFPSHGRGLGMESLTWTRELYFVTDATDQSPQQTQAPLSSFSIYARVISNSTERVYGWEAKTYSRVPKTNPKSPKMYMVELNYEKRYASLSGYKIPSVGIYYFNHITPHKHGDYFMSKTEFLN